MKGCGVMYCTYPAIVHKGEEYGYWAEFIDFNAFTQGGTLNELMTNAEEAMICHISDELNNGAVLPLPSDIKSIRTKENEFATLIHANIPDPSHSLVLAQNIAMAT